MEFASHVLKLLFGCYGERRNCINLIAENDSIPYYINNVGNDTYVVKEL